MSGGRVLVVQHEEACPVEWFGGWLADAGVAVDVLPAHEGAPVPTSIVGYDGLLVLGGEMGAYDDDRYPWLAGTRALIATTVCAGRGFLGVCLGHQLAAVALGGEVERNQRGAATGLTTVTLTPAGERDPLLGVVPPGSLAIQWNNDVVSRLPVRAAALATAPDGTISAARFGRRAWGVQFHPEASPRVFRRWAAQAQCAAKPSAGTSGDQLDGQPASRVDPSTAAQLVEAAEDELRHAWEPFARRFAALALQPLPVP